MKAPDPYKPLFELKLPEAMKGLAKAGVHKMSPSLDPSKMSPEAIMATLWVTVQELKSSLEKMERHQTWQMRIAVGGLIGIVGTLFATLLHLAGAYVTALAGHVKP